MNENVVDNSIPDIWDAEDKIFSLCMLEVEEFPQYLTKIEDIEDLYHSKFLGEDLKGLNLDSVRQRKNGDLINIEHHSSINPDLLRRDFEYIVAVHARSKRHVWPYIFNTGKIPTVTMDNINPTIFYNPCWINTLGIDASQKLNNIKYKLSNSEVIDVFEILDLIWMPKFKSIKSVEEIILELVDIYRDLIVEEKLLHVFRRSLLIWTGKYIKDEQKLKKVKEGLNMSALEIGSIYEDIKAARISGELMRSKEEGFEEGREEGIAEGIKEGRGEFISKLLEDMAPEEIASKFDVELDEIMEIRDSML